MHRHPHILNAASNLLGICFVLIGALKFTNSNEQSFADEAAWLAAAFFLTSIATSYLAIRNDDANRWQNVAADVTFFLGILLLAIAMIMAALVL